MPHSRGHQHYTRVLPQDAEAPGEEEGCGRGSDHRRGLQRGWSAPAHHQAEVDAVLGQGEGRQARRGVRAACNSDQGCSEEGVYADWTRWEEQEGGIHRACGGGAEAAGECIEAGEVLLQ